MAKKIHKSLEALVLMTGLILIIALPFTIGLFITLTIGPLYDIPWINHRLTIRQYNEALNIKIPVNSVLLEEYDTHGGFHGDGESYIVYEIEKEFFKDLIKENTWGKTPLSENINKISYWFIDDIENKQNPIPFESSNLYYKFVDRGQNKEKPFWNRGSVNFTIGFFETTDNKLYILEEDS